MVGIESIKKAIRDLVQGNEIRSSITDNQGNLVSDTPNSVMAQRMRLYSQSFEDGTTDTEVNDATQTVQNSEYYTGSYALMVPVASGQTGYIQTPYKQVSVGQKVVFSFAHKEDANIASIEFVAVWYRSEGRVLVTESYSVPLSSDWEVYEKELIAPAKAKYVGLRIRATAGEADGSFYIDDIGIDVYGQFAELVEGGIKVTDPYVLSGLQPARSETEHVLESETVAAGGVRDFVISDSNGYSAIVLTVKATYDASATQGVRVRWLYSPNGSDYDSEDAAEAEGQYNDIAFTTGATKVETVLIPLFQPYVKVQVVNLDSSYAVVVDAWTTKLR